MNKPIERPVDKPVNKPADINSKSRSEEYREFN